jgi:hypothetical protein
MACGRRNGHGDGRLLPRSFTCGGRGRYLRGFRVGGGAKYWQNDVRRKTSGQSASWDNVAATLGGGYVWKFYGNFYLNLWGAGHLIVGGDTKVPVGAETFEPSRFTGEVSLNVGWHF